MATTTSSPLLPDRPRRPDAPEPVDPILIGPRDVAYLLALEDCASGLASAEALLLEETAAASQWALGVRAAASVLRKASS